MDASSTADLYGFNSPDMEGQEVPATDRGLALAPFPAAKSASVVVAACRAVAVAAAAAVGVPRALAVRRGVIAVGAGAGVRGIIETASDPSARRGKGDPRAEDTAESKKGEGHLGGAPCRRSPPPLIHPFRPPMTTGSLSRGAN